MGVKRTVRLGIDVATNSNAARNSETRLGGIGVKFGYAPPIFTKIVNVV